ncbi:MAG: hypothetical protein KDA58_04880, partial [Planctomycetaceae bacterium]|nr:hypothetical protein [Planctomycetaceae bacterium]
MQLHVSYSFHPKTRSVRSSQVMDHFGIDFDHGEHVIANGFDLPLNPAPAAVDRGQIVLFTGASGSGKSSLMRAAAEAITAHLDASTPSPAAVLDIETLNLGTAPLVDALPLPIEQTMH